MGAKSSVDSDYSIYWRVLVFICVLPVWSVFTAYLSQLHHWLVSLEVFN